MIFAFLAVSSYSKLSCRNYDDNKVDWYALFKTPIIKDVSDSLATGLTYFYHDDKNLMKQPDGFLNNTYVNPFYHSMKPMYGNDPNVGYLLVSDQPPGGTIPSSRAHMKGVVIFDKDNGIYIEHSIPRFPPNPAEEGYSYPSNGVRYGQSALCMTLEHEDIERVAQGMLIQRPGIYANNFPSYTEEKMPSLIKVVENLWNKKDETKTFPLKAGKKVFTLFAKSKDWGKDLYESFIAPHYQTDVLAETWSNGRGTMESGCSAAYHAYNVLNLEFPGATWKRSKDHSKWCAGDKQVCIGGINRQFSQTKRGGGSICLVEPNWAKVMHDIVESFEDCP